MSTDNHLLGLEKGDIEDGLLRLEEAMECRSNRVVRVQDEGPLVHHGEGYVSIWVIYF